MTGTTPLHAFFDLIHETPNLANLTDEGMAHLRSQAYAALPFLPTLVTTGTWIDWTENTAAAAIAAVRAVPMPSSEPLPEYLQRDPDMQETEDWDAVYLVGLLVGLALAQTLIMGSGDPKWEAS